eukprot:7565438-Pyramimonas_sp.AAC.1
MFARARARALLGLWCSRAGSGGEGRSHYYIDVPPRLPARHPAERITAGPKMGVGVLTQAKAQYTTPKHARDAQEVLRFVTEDVEARGREANGASCPPRTVATSEHVDEVQISAYRPCG